MKTEQTTQMQKLSQKQLHKLLCRDLGIKTLSFFKKEKTLFDELGIKELK